MIIIYLKNVRHAPELQIERIACRIKIGEQVPAASRRSRLEAVHGDILLVILHLLLTGKGGSVVFQPGSPLPLPVFIGGGKADIFLVIAPHIHIVAAEDRAEAAALQLLVIFRKAVQIDSVIPLLLHLDRNGDIQIAGSVHDHIADGDIRRIAGFRVPLDELLHLLVHHDVVVIGPDLLPLGIEQIAYIFLIEKIQLLAGELLGHQAVFRDASRNRSQLLVHLLLHCLRVNAALQAGEKYMVRPCIRAVGHEHRDQKAGILGFRGCPCLQGLPISHVPHCAYRKALALVVGSIVGRFVGVDKAHVLLVVQHLKVNHLVRLIFMAWQNIKGIEALDLIFFIIKGFLGLLHLLLHVMRNINGKGGRLVVLH